MFKRVIATVAMAATICAFGVATAVILALLLTKSARSQPPTQMPASEQALGNKLLAEIQAGLSCSAATIQLQMRVRELEAKLADAEKAKEQK